MKKRLIFILVLVTNCFLLYSQLSTEPHIGVVEFKPNNTKFFIKRHFNSLLSEFNKSKLAKIGINANVNLYLPHPTDTFVPYAEQKIILYVRPLVGKNHFLVPSSTSWHNIFYNYFYFSINKDYYENKSKEELLKIVFTKGITKISDACGHWRKTKTDIKNKHQFHQNIRLKAEWNISEIANLIEDCECDEEKAEDKTVEEDDFRNGKTESVPNKEDNFSEYDFWRGKTTSEIDKKSNSANEDDFWPGKWQQSINISYTETTTGVPFDMVAIPGGIFRIGEGGNGGNETPPSYDITISDFYMGKTEVTFAEYDAYCEDQNKEKPSDAGWGRGNRPVINVSWYDAKAYCAWLSEKTGKNYRLPSEAEWEYAARGGENYIYAGSNNIDEVAWYTRTTNDKGTREVATKMKNGYGLYDMSGNVWERCEDDWLDSYADGVSKDGSAWTKSSRRANRVNRGGSWGNHASCCRVLYRSNWYPSSRHYGVGFRLARSL